MAFYSGIDGVLNFGSGSSTNEGGCAAKVKNWQWSVNQEVLDTTSICDTDRTLIPSTRSTSGSCSLHYYGTNSAASSLIDKIQKSSGSKSGLVTFKLTVDGRAITIPAYITSASMNCSVGEVVSVDITFEGTGAASNNF